MKLVDLQLKEAQLIGLQIDATLAGARSLDRDVKLIAALGAVAYCALKDGASTKGVREAFELALKNAETAVAQEIS